MSSPSPPPAARERSRPLVLGVLGGIASGKSRVARLLAGPEGVVLCADEIAHQVLASAELVRLVRERFGEAVLDADGRIDHGALAERVFDAAGGAQARRELESWTHPRVRERILERMREARAAGVARVALDVPLLLENDARHGLARQCDALVFVDAPLELREERARSSRGWKAGEIERRESAQLPLPEKRKRADFVVPNHGSLEELERAVEDVLRKLEAH